MAKSYAKTLNIVAMLLLAAMVVGLISLGNWQLSRAQQRREVAAAMEQGRQRAPLELSAEQDEQALQAWRPAVAKGVWLNQYSVLLDNRNLDGRPGLWLATPLQLADGSAVLVLRGWLPRPVADQPGQRAQISPAITLQGAPGEQTVSGSLSSRVPRLYELWSPIAQPQSGLPQGWPVAQEWTEASAVERMLRVQNLSIEELSRRSGLRFIPTVLLQVDNMEDGLKRVWPGPSTDADKNVGYAMQWFGFAAIAGLVLLGLLYRTLRKRRQRAA
jgi:surfeit locus 1 family protein